MLLLGNCNDKLKEIKDNSIDLILTDPPYGIEFMGKDWDKAVVPTETWKECYRILKQGKLAFIMCSPRQDVLSRMIVNLQDAGFRTNYTSIYWTFAQGFPKAANISKMIDKRGGVVYSEETRIPFANYLKQKIQESGLTNLQIREKAGIPLKGGGPISQWTGLTERSHPKVPTVEMYKKLKEILQLGDQYDNFIKEEQEREVIGTKVNIITGFSHDRKQSEYNITKPATEAAKAMEGAYVGFQPKPALEIVLKLQKPFSPEGELTIITSQCLCLIQCLSVNSAVKNSNLLQTVRDFIAQNIAMDRIVQEAIASIGKVGEEFVQTDILKSILGELMEKQDTNWNTALLWKSILVGLLAKANKFTTETITEQIIELKTLNLLLSQSITNDIIPQEKIKQNGSRLNASIVENILANVLIRLLPINNTTVHSNASQLNQELDVKPVTTSLMSLDVLSEKENTAQSNVTTQVAIVVSKGKTLSWLDSVKIPEGETKRFPANLLVSDNVLDDYSRYFSLDQWWAKTFPFLIVPKPAKSEKGEFNSHPTVKSQKLMSYLITMGSREGDLVLDPFCGSGTTLLAAHHLHRKYLGIELNPEYAQIIKKRMLEVQAQLKLSIYQ